MEQKLDEKDFAILDILEKHGEYTVRKIARKTNIAPTTVHARIRKLKKTGVIRKFTIDIDRRKLGKKIGAYILISADLKFLKEKNRSQYDLSKEIERFSGVEMTNIVTGGTDIISMVWVKDIQELDSLLLNKIQLLEGVSKTQTMIIIH